MATVQEVNASLDGISTALDEIVTDEQALMDEIKKLQDQVAAGSPVTQAELDQLAAKATAIHTKASGAAATVPTPINP